MPPIGSVRVVVEGVPPGQPEDIEYLRLQAAVLSAPEWSPDHYDALKAIVAFTTARSAEQHRKYAEMCSKWDPRRWWALWGARRCERELVEAGEG